MLLVIFSSLLFVLLLLFCSVYVAAQGRVLELLVLLDEHWQKHRLGSYKLVLLHNTAFNTGEFAKSQVGDLKPPPPPPPPPNVYACSTRNKKIAGFLVRKIERVSEKPSMGCTTFMQKSQTRGASLTGPLRRRVAAAFNLHLFITHPHPPQAARLAWVTFFCLRVLVC